MSKSNRKKTAGEVTWEIARKIRGDWGNISPVTKTIPNKKKNQKAKHKGECIMKINRHHYFALMYLILSILWLDIANETSNILATIMVAVNGFAGAFHLSMANTEV